MFYKAITIQQWCAWVIALLSSIESPHNTQEVCPRATVESDINRGLLPAGPVPPDQLQWKLKLLREILHIPLLSISTFLNDLSWPTIKTPGFSLFDPLHLIPLLNCTENTRRSKWCERAAAFKIFSTQQIKWSVNLSKLDIKIFLLDMMTHFMLYGFRFLPSDWSLQYLITFDCDIIKSCSL